MPEFYLPSEDEFDPSIDDFVLKVEAKERRYKHFDLPLSDAQRKLAIDFTQEEKPHRFLPLLGFTHEVRRYVRDKDGKRECKIKGRPIRYASHADAAYLQAYAEYLNSYYEEALVKDGTADSVLAYRKGGGTNIHHAKSLFDEVVKRKNCTVIAMDISGFFDCLDHVMLRDEIAGLFGCERLDGHHATIWKNITRYSWVETKDIDMLLGKKRNERGRICSSADFTQHVRGRKHGLVVKHDLPFGIPQGTPVSGLYANVYMLTFDRRMKLLCDQCDGSYRRYSDDIAVVIPLGTKVRHVVAIVEKILADFNLAISAKKTEHAHFREGHLVSPKPIQYLGFTFDGRQTLLRPSTLDAYRSKMRHGIHAKLVAAKAKGIQRDKIFRREALSRYTHLGKRRNFLKYAYKAADIMNSDEIKRQVKPHMTWFKRTWKKEMSKVFD